VQIYSVRRLLPVVASLLFATIAAAQGGSLTGRVTTKDAGRPLDNARITISDGARTTGVATSGETGLYAVPNVAAGTYTVTVSRIGYQLQRFPGITIRAGQPTQLNASLDEIPTQLNQVVTTASRKPEKALDAPAALSVVTRETIERKPSISVADLVKGQPGIDVSNGGIAQSMIVARGFNNAFSGSLLMLQDYRFAGVPSLRVNVPYLSLGQMEDIERVEFAILIAGHDVVRAGRPAEHLPWCHPTCWHGGEALWLQAERRVHERRGFPVPRSGRTDPDLAAAHTWRHAPAGGQLPRLRL
jgi:outer membrane receptor for ferrienterochelin and colicins